MKIVCIGMDEQGQFFVGMKPEGMEGAPPEMNNEGDPIGGDPGPQGPESYMQPVQSMPEAFQAARSMLTEGNDAAREADFDAGVKRVLGPNPKPQIGGAMGAGKPAGGPPMPMRGGMKGGM